MIQDVNTKIGSGDVMLLPRINDEGKPNSIGIYFVYEASSSRLFTSSINQLSSSIPKQFAKSINTCVNRIETGNSFSSPKQDKQRNMSDNSAHAGYQSHQMDGDAAAKTMDKGANSYVFFFNSVSYFFFSNLVLGLCLTTCVWPFSFV